MKLNIREMLNGYVENDIEIRGKNVVSTDKIKEVTMDKIIETKTKKRIFRPSVIIAAVCILTVLFGTTAMAYFLKWGGFALTNELSDEEIDQLLAEASTGTGTVSVSIDSDGNCTYYDENGNVLFVLTEEESREFDERLREEREEAVQISTELLDTDTMNITPNSITLISVDDEGIVPDFMLGNGHMVLLTNEDDSGWSFKSGDTVTIELESNDECVVTFGMVKDTVMIEEGVIKSEKPTWNFTISEYGEYYFTVLYASAAASSFTNGLITVQAAS